MNDNFKYYGFYGRKGNTNLPNYRASRQKASSDPQVNYKEFGVYVHTENRTIIEHLNKEYKDGNTTNGEHYPDVPNLTFMPIDGLPINEKDEVQELITSFYSLYLDASKQKISWGKLHAFGREYMYSGYDSELSKEIVDLYADEAEKEFNSKNNFLKNDFFKSLKIQKSRKCDNVHNVKNTVLNNDTRDSVGKEVILEDLLIKKNEQQLILGDLTEIKKYDNNPKTYLDPWLYRWTEFGFLVWNIMINKATVKCILDHSTALFPIQIVLSTNPNYLLYDQIDNDEINIKYIGYFIARINFEELEKPTIVVPECDRLYDTTFDKIHDTKQKYFVIFVFKNNTGNKVTEKYLLTDFRLQRIHFGNLTRSKKVLFIEIQQLMCSMLNEDETIKTTEPTEQIIKTTEPTEPTDKTIKTTEPTEPKQPIKTTGKTFTYLLSEYKYKKPQKINDICRSQEENKIILKILKETQVPEKQKLKLELELELELELKLELNLESITINNEILEILEEINKLIDRPNKDKEDKEEKKDKEEKELNDKLKIWYYIKKKTPKEQKELKEIWKKKENNKCYETWLDDETIKILDDNNIELVSESKSYNIFLAKKDINDIEKELIERVEGKDLFIGQKVVKVLKGTAKFENLTISEPLPDGKTKDYILFKCHFKWSEILNKKDKKLDKKYGHKKRFVIKHGDLNLIDNSKYSRDDPEYFNSKQYYEKELCIKGTCILDRDYITQTYNNIKYYNKNIHIPSNYLQYLEKYKKILNISDDTILEYIYNSLKKQSLQIKDNLEASEKINFINELNQIIEDNEQYTNTQKKLIEFEKQFNELIKKYSKSPDQPPVQPPDQPPVQPPDQPSVQPPDQPHVQLPDQPHVQLPDQPPVQPPDQPHVQLPDQPSDQPPDKKIVQYGGSNSINKIYKLIKKIKLFKYNLKHIILSNNSLYLDYIKLYSNIGLNLFHILNINNNNNNYKKYLSIDNYIYTYFLSFIPLIQHIKKGNILIFSNNINILLILDYYLNINIYSSITLVLIDIHIKSLIFFKNNITKFKNKDKIKIYYIGNILNNELINNIINFFPNTKFSNIIFDIFNNNKQIFYNILSIKICKELLINNGSFIQYSKIPDIKDNLIYLYYFIFKCFNYNIFDTHTYKFFEDNMYSLIYHKNFNYILNDEEENIINNLLNTDILQKTNFLKNITVDTLFIDYIYIKYLNIYYTLKNSAQKIFKKSYNILENKTIEQQGGYQINNTSILDGYNYKYTCTFLEKQLFLLHLNCLTKVYLYENKNLDNFYIYYDDILPADDNEYYRYYQDILKNMFKQLTWTNQYDKSKECIFISNNLDMYHKIKPKYALMDLKPDTDTDNNFFDGEILYTLYPFSNTDFKILVKEYNKIKKYSDNIFQELLDNNKFFSLCYNYDIYNINKVIPIKYLKLIPGYTDNLECILEYKILYNYFYCIHNITDHTIIMNKLFDITIDNENNIKYWINCTLNKFKNAENETDIMFKNIVKLNIEQHAKHQIQLLNDYGSEVLNKQKISKAIKILEKYASDRVYIQIL